MIVPTLFTSPQTFVNAMADVDTGPGVVYRKVFPDQKELDIERWEVPYEELKDANGKPWNFGPGVHEMPPDHCYQYQFEYVSGGEIKALGQCAANDYPFLHLCECDVITIFDSKLVADEAVFLEKYDLCTELRCFANLSETPGYDHLNSVILLVDKEVPQHIFAISGTLSIDSDHLSAIDINSFDCTVRHFTYANGKWDCPTGARIPFVEIKPKQL